MKIGLGLLADSRYKKTIQNGVHIFGKASRKACYSDSISNDS